jgi:hypothetical protein
MLNRQNEVIEGLIIVREEVKKVTGRYENIQTISRHSTPFTKNLPSRRGVEFNYSGKSNMSQKSINSI